MSERQLAGRRLRFGPSPTGALHLGNARTALFNWLVARQGGGRFVLRIEDTDVQRDVAGAEQRILDDLRWLRLDWDEGPDTGGPFGPYRQSERHTLYREAGERLLAKGRAYRCFCDERRLERDRERRRAAGKAPHYPGRCRGLTADESRRRAADGEPHAVRFRVDVVAESDTVAFDDRLRGRIEFPLGQLGDTVILRQDGRPTYNFAVVVDDAAMEIDLVIRGDDHLSNTPRQVLMFRALEGSVPEFAHLPMVRGADGRRLSKRHGAVSVAEYRRRGYPVDGLVNALALLGWAPGADRSLVDRDELLRLFDLDRVNLSPATFDVAKLEWICAQHVQRMPVSRLAESLRTSLADVGWLPARVPDGAGSWLEGLAELLRPSLSHFGEVPDRAGALFFAGGEPTSAPAREVLQASGSAEVVRALAEAATEAPESWADLLARVRERTAAKGKALFQPLRAALTGAVHGPELDRLVPLIQQGAALFPDAVNTVSVRAQRTREWLDGGQAGR